MVLEMRELVTSATRLVRSEARLARAEILHQARNLGKHSGRVIACALIAWLGAHALLAFAVLGLGEILGDNYWLSALIVGLLLIGPSAILGWRAIRSIQAEASLKMTMGSLQDDQKAIQERMRHFKESVSAGLGARPAREARIRRVS